MSFHILSLGELREMRKLSRLKRIFRENLATWMANRPLGVVARSLGMNYKQLHRWLTQGIERPDHRSFPHILKLAEFIGLSDWSRLWEEGLFKPPQPSPASPLDEARRACAKKATILARDERWLPALIEVVDHLWEQRERSLAASSLPENDHQESEDEP